jgi:NADPH:quinone reductase-like Zn-dependent oxidoreductase
MSYTYGVSIACQFNLDVKERGSMKAIVQTKYGSPEVLSLQEVDRPVVSNTGVLVRIHATSVHAGDWHLMRGTPWLLRLMFGLFKPKHQILGTDMAGTVAEIGVEVTQFKIGDRVFGDLSASGFGGFAEYVCVPESALALKPDNLTFAQAATVPASALAALQGLRDVGKIRSGQQVLINGAAGGVGSFAVQIARATGAIVTAVCSSRNIEMVRSICADHILDYTQIDITQTGHQYDLILDVAAYRSVFDYLPILKPKGTYVLVGGSTARIFQVLIFGALMSKFTDRQILPLISTPNRADLLTLKSTIEAGTLVPIVDRYYDLSEVPIALHQLEQGQVSGKISIRIV